MEKLLLILLTGLCCFTLNFFLLNACYAQGPIDLKSPLAATTIEGIIKGIISFLFEIGIVLAPLMILAGGFLFVTAGGNLEQINRAKKIILWTIIGFLIVLLAQGIIGLIENLLGVTSS